LSGPYSVSLSRKAEKYLERCNAPTRDRLRHKFEEIKADPFEPQHSKPLKGRGSSDQRELAVSEFSFAWKAPISSSRRSALAARSTSTGCDPNSSRSETVSFVGGWYQFVAASQSRVCIPSRRGPARAVCLYKVNRSPYRLPPTGRGACGSRKQNKHSLVP